MGEGCAVEGGEVRGELVWMRVGGWMGRLDGAGGFGCLSVCLAGCLAVWLGWLEWAGGSDWATTEATRERLYEGSRDSTRALETHGGSRETQGGYLDHGGYSVGGSASTSVGTQSTQTLLPLCLSTNRRMQTPCPA